MTQQVAPRALNILLVEDLDDDIFFFELALKKTGMAHNLTYARDGREALELLQRWHTGTGRGWEGPDFIFIDLKLPIINGFEVLKWICQKNFQPALNVIATSGSDQGGDMRQALELGAADYLVKPVTADMLRKHLAPLENRSLPQSVTELALPSHSRT